MPWDTNNEKSKKEEEHKIAEQYHEEFVKAFNAMSFSYDLYSKTETEYHAKKFKKYLKNYMIMDIYERSNHRNLLWKMQ